MIYYNQGDIPKALEYYRQCLKIAQENKDKEGEMYSSNYISNALSSKGNLTEALGYAKHGLQLAKEIGYPEAMRNAASSLKFIYEKQNNFKDALTMYELNIQMQDSINNQETKKASIKKQFQYEYEKKAAKDSVLNEEEQKIKDALLATQKAQLDQEKTKRYALYGGIFLILVFTFFVLNRFRVTQRQKVIIEKQKVRVDKAYEHLHEKNKEVMDSINYASRIQRALLPSQSYISNQFKRLMKN